MAVSLGDDYVWLDRYDDSVAQIHDATDCTLLFHGPVTDGTPARDGDVVAMLVFEGEQPAVQLVDLAPSTEPPLDLYGGLSFPR